MVLTLEDFGRLSTRLVYGLHDVDTGHASVLIIIYGPEPTFVMTKKSPHLRIHAGEIAFPGGKHEDMDADLLHTAIRETREEIGLQVSKGHIIGNLAPVRTLNSNFTIMPYVCLLDGLGDTIHNGEVEEILHIPADGFLQTLQDDHDPAHVGTQGTSQDMYTLAFGEHVVWGASARMLKQISDVVCA